VAQGAARALVANKRANKTGDLINLIGFAWADKLVKRLPDDAIAALLIQDPFRIVYDGIKTALAACELVPTTIDTGTALITKANGRPPWPQELIHFGILRRPTSFISCGRSGINQPLVRSFAEWEKLKGANR
jgi:ribose transport system substrate-binding protein